jgi:cellulose synthase/poly-beta-1,6-N-acetylglucosamine synthase-like glycosyltransferase
VIGRLPPQAGWFPEWTLTEDFALGIELKRLGWQCRYVSEYLAVGEAPEEVRNCFQQRSRWSKGHFQVGVAGVCGDCRCEAARGRLLVRRSSQKGSLRAPRDSTKASASCPPLPAAAQVFFSRHNPVFARGLSPLMRWMYGSVILSYLSAFTSTPLLMLVPMVTVRAGQAAARHPNKRLFALLVGPHSPTPSSSPPAPPPQVWLGSFPIVINSWAAISITVYYAATLLVRTLPACLPTLPACARWLCLWAAVCRQRPPPVVQVMYYTRTLAHLKSMWFSSVGGGGEEGGRGG